MQEKIKDCFKKDMSRRAFWVLVALTVLAKLVLVHFQCIWTWIDGAPLDDELMFHAAQSISAGQWLGEYNWLTLSKHMFFPVWLALANALHIPYLLAGQLLLCGAALAAAFAFAPVLRRWKSRYLLFALLAFNPASTASFTLRVYRDNIFPQLCLLFFAGLIGYALRYRQPLKKGLPWLVCSGLGLGLAWITREDGIWLMPFALVGSGIILISVLHQKGLDKKLWRCAALLIPIALLAVCTNVMCAINYAHYGVYVLSDFSGGSFAQAFGAMTRPEHENWQPLVSVPADVRAQLYDKVDELEPLEYWLEEYAPMRNGYINRELNDYQTGSFYWVMRRAAQEEGVYKDAVTAQNYWQAVADEVNALCDSGEIKAAKRHHNSTTPPIRMEYVPDVLQEGLHSLWFTATFQDCEASLSELTIGPVEDLAVWEEYLGSRTNHAAIAGTADPFYSPLQNFAYTILHWIRNVYAVLLPLALVAAAGLQIYQAVQMIRRKNGRGLLLWMVLLGVLGMALFRTFMIAFVEVASFNIGTYVMYLSTVHPLLILYAAAGVLTALPMNRAEKE